MKAQFPSTTPPAPQTESSHTPHAAPFRRLQPRPHHPCITIDILRGFTDKLLKRIETLCFHSGAAAGERPPIGVHLCYGGGNRSPSGRTIQCGKAQARSRYSGG